MCMNHKNYKKTFIILLSILGGFALTLFFLLHKNEKNSVKIGILLAQKGPFAQQELPIIRAVQIAMDEINATGGINGAKLMPVFTNSELQDNDFKKEAELLITRDKVSCLLGCRDITSRQQVKDIVEKHNNLLLYPVQWTGLESSTNIVYVGTTPNQQIIPILRWAQSNFDKNITIIGADDMFTHIIHAIITYYMKHMGIALFDTHFIPLNSKEYTSQIDALQKNKPDVLLNIVADRNQSEFFKELYATGITPYKIPLISLVFSDNDHELNQDHLFGSYVSKSYFQSFRSQKNKEFIEKIQRRYPDQKVITTTMELAYTAVHLWAQAARQAQSQSATTLLPFLHKQTFDAPEGPIAVSHLANCCWHIIRVAKVMADGTYSDLWSSKRPIEPLPYPPFNTKKQWDNFLETIYQQWKIS